MISTIEQVSEGKQTNRITLETLCGLFRCAGWINIESDTRLGNLTWGSLPVGCQGVMKKNTNVTLRKKFVTTIVQKKLKKKLDIVKFYSYIIV
jgi:hypothetical protein